MDVTFSEERRTFGPYPIWAEIGRGSLGIVYKAQEPALSRAVALRLLPAHWADYPEFLARFKREVEIAAQLRHPHIMRVYAVGELEGFHYVAMEYLPGWSLKQLLEECRGPLALPQAVRVTEQIADALDYAHAQGHLHLDVKPANIRLQLGNSATLTDFGVARALYSGESLPAGLTAGTAEYMAPEQSEASEGKTVDGRTDIYALGVVAFHMLTGQVPFESEAPESEASARAVLMKHVMEPPPSLRQLNPELPAEVEQAVLRALAKRPEERYQRAGQFARVLVEAAGLAPATRQAAAKRATAAVAPPQKPPASSGRLLVLAGGGLVFLTGIGVALWMRSQAPVPVESEASTATPTPIASEASTLTPTAIPSPSRTPSPTATETATRTPLPPTLTRTPTPVPPTDTPTLTNTPSSTPTRIRRPPTQTPTPTPSPTDTPLPTNTPEPTERPPEPPPPPTQPPPPPTEPPPQPTRTPHPL